jgi:hypothetical protein
MLTDAGFADVRVEEKAESREFIKDWMPGSGAENYVVSANVTAVKPKKKTETAVEANEDASAAAAAAAATKAFASAAGTSASVAAPVGAAAMSLLTAIGKLMKTMAEHHAAHTDDVPAAESCREPEPAKEKKAGC